MLSRRTSHLDHLHSVLEAIETRETETRDVLSKYSRATQEPDRELDSPCPIFDRFYTDGGSEAIQRLTNISVREFSILWASLRTHVVRYWNVGRGRRSQHTGKDVLFMTLTVLKVRGTWDSLAHIFLVKTPSFSKMITGFIRVISPKLYVIQVAARAKEETTHRIVTSGRAFTHYPCALNTDVTFQQANRPGGNIAEALPYYSAKHKLYGYKVEVSVSPRGFAINCTDHTRGNTPDISMFRENEAFHHATRQKGDRDRELADNGPMSDKYPDEWAVLTDKGYQGLAEHVRCIHPVTGLHVAYQGYATSAL